MFLKITGIEGESADAKHKGSIDIESFSWRRHPIGSAGRQSGRRRWRHRHGRDAGLPLRDALEQGVAQALPGRRQRSAHQGGDPHRPQGRGKEQIEFLKIKFSDILVSLYQQAASADSDTPNDSFSLNFSKIEIDYLSQDPGGKAGDSIRASWDLKLSKG